MKTDNIRELADFLEQEVADGQFDMSFFFNSAGTCGTAACVAGWACVLADEYTIQSVRAGREEAVIDTRTGEAIGFSEAARRYLGLDRDRAQILFYPHIIWHIPTKHFTREKAIKTLRHLAKTGEVEWDV